MKPTKHFVYCYTCKKFLQPYYDLESIVVSQKNGHKNHKLGLKLDSK